MPSMFSIHTDGCRVLDISFVFRMGLDECFESEEIRLARRLNAFI